VKEKNRMLVYLNVSNYKGDFQVISKIKKVIFLSWCIFLLSTFINKNILSLICFVRVDFSEQYRFHGNAP
jgi:uncharacterized membrane protein YcgQ (UPF0703/DUF1980 family)